MTKQELRDVIRAFIRDEARRTGLLTGLTLASEALTEAAAECGFARPGVEVRLQRLTYEYPDHILSDPPR